MKVINTKLSVLAGGMCPIIQETLKSVLILTDKGEMWVRKDSLSDVGLSKVVFYELEKGCLEKYKSKPAWIDKTKLPVLHRTK